MSTIEELKKLREWEDHAEFKRAENNYPFSGGSKSDPRERRHCVLGYIVALANERGGRLVLGMEDEMPHNVSGTNFAEGETGALEDEIYKRLNIRVKAEELYDDAKRRVLVLNVPSRPVGKALRFEGVPLMRVGESIREMDDAEYFRIISEQDPDFSANVCKGMTFDDLDQDAIKEMRQLIYAKRKNASVLTSPLKQLLSDLELLTAEGLTYAALVLIGKREAIRRFLPQYNVVVEYRIDHSMIRYTAREEFCGPMFLIIESVWKYINQPASNPLQHVEDLPQIIDIPAFNRETVREALINAMIHRSMQMTGDILVKQYPDLLVITNPGGFPYGVNLGNILTVNSSPRSRRIAEVVEKAGLIERSGQGIDIMFSNCVEEGKALPDYSQSDDYQVSLSLSGKIIHPRLMLMIRNYQKGEETANKLNAFDLVSLYQILGRRPDLAFKDSIERLKRMGLIVNSEKYGYTMGDLYYETYPAVKSGIITAGEMRLLYEIVGKDDSAPISSFIEKMPDLSVKRVRNFVNKCCANEILESEGNGRATRYKFKKMSYTEKS